jgi:hypothetical protein
MNQLSAHNRKINISYFLYYFLTVCSFFFSCFIAAWREHSKRHQNIRKMTTLSDAVTTPPNEAVDNESTTEGEEEAEDGVDGQNEENKPITSISSVSYDEGDADLQEWNIICTERTYIPTAEDVGSRFRVDVWVFSSSDNSLLAGPTTLFTEPVLSAPSKPPKRALQTIPGSGSGISGAIRFRTVSYNVLAEQYATKQVSRSFCMYELRLLFSSFFLLGLSLL